MEKDYRLFVKYLPPTITNEKLQKLFEKYGLINEVDIKEKLLNDGSKFAFINISSTDQKLNNCYRDINSTVLEGNNITVKLANENFLDKLKREREEAQAKVSSKSDNKAPNRSIEPLNIKIPEKVKNQQKSLPPHFYKHNEAQNLLEDTKEYYPQIKKTNEDLAVISNTERNLCESEQKRLASLKQKKQSFRSREQLIRSALKAVDKKKNKIIFSEENETTINNDSNQKESTNLQLFENEDDENENNEIFFDFDKKQKPKAQTIGNDRRFVMDKNFFDENENNSLKKDESDEEEEEEEEEEGEKEELVKEKKKQLKILEDVLGKPILKNNDKQVPVKRTHTMIRYDPTKDDHRQHELKTESQSPEKKKRKKKNEMKVEVKEDHIPVSNEIFFSVSNNLKESLNTQEEFSLLRNFGTASVSDDKNDNNAAEAIAHQTAKLSMNFNSKNPFKYDSTDDEDEEDMAENNIPPDNQTKINGLNNVPYEETFFFTSDDPRFNDAIEFFNKPSTTDESFKNIRRELKQIVRTKVRNNVRKNQLWNNKKAKIKRR